MKRAVLGLAGLVALGAAAPAGAADLPVYTKTPAMVATIYDWSGFYVGVNVAEPRHTNAGTSPRLPRPLH